MVSQKIPKSAWMIWGYIAAQRWGRSAGACGYPGMFLRWFPQSKITWEFPRWFGCILYIIYIYQIISSYVCYIYGWVAQMASAFFGSVQSCDFHGLIGLAARPERFRSWCERLNRRHSPPRLENARNREANPGSHQLHLWNSMIIINIYDL